MTEPEPGKLTRAIKGLCRARGVCLPFTEAEKRKAGGWVKYAELRCKHDLCEPFSVVDAIDRSGKATAEDQSHSSGLGLRVLTVPYPDVPVGDGARWHVQRSFSEPPLVVLESVTVHQLARSENTVRLEIALESEALPRSGVFVIQPTDRTKLHCRATATAELELGHSIALGEVRSRCESENAVMVYVPSTEATGRSNGVVTEIVKVRAR